MKLFANGCSFTWGGELFKRLHDDNWILLDENNTSDQNIERLNVTWPRHLSDIMGYSEFHNWSMGCGSNQRIVRKTFDFFLPKILNGEDMSEWTAAIQFSEPSRFETFQDDADSWLMVNVQNATLEKPTVPVIDQQLLDNYYMLFNDKVLGQLFFNDICTLGHFFKQHNIKHVFTMIHCGFIESLTDDQIKYCNKEFNWFNNKIEISSIMDMNVEECENDPHPSRTGHKQIAEHLSRFL